MSWKETNFHILNIKPKAIDLTTRLWGITTEFLVFIPLTFVLRSIVLSWILIYRNWSMAKAFQASVRVGINVFLATELMQSRVWQPCKFIGTKERFYVKKVLNRLHRIGLVQQHGHCFETPIWLPWRHVHTLYLTKRTEIVKHIEGNPKWIFDAFHMVPFYCRFGIPNLITWHMVPFYCRFGIPNLATNNCFSFDCDCVLSTIG